MRSDPLGTQFCPAYHDVSVLTGVASRSFCQYCRNVDDSSCDALRFTYPYRPLSFSVFRRNILIFYLDAPALRHPHGTFFWKYRVCTLADRCMSLWNLPTNALFHRFGIYPLLSALSQQKTAVLGCFCRGF